MLSKNFEAIAKDITGVNIEILVLENQAAKKWYEKTYIKTDRISENTIYGISIENSVAFDLKVGKIESLLRTFITQYINKYMLSTYCVENGELVKHTKETALRTLSNVQPRHAYMCAYSTNYGVGVWVFYVKKETIETVNNAIFSILKAKGINYNNEYSEAGWVYRHKFSGSYQDHNIIINELAKVLSEKTQ